VIEVIIYKIIEEGCYIIENPYKILGVTPFSSKDQIKKAFRKKARKHHPDVGGDVEYYMNIKDAYERLLNKENINRCLFLGIKLQWAIGTIPAALIRLTHRKD
jgi:preprotein translocase subunit Sec63